MYSIEVELVIKKIGTHFGAPMDRRRPAFTYSAYATFAYSAYATGPGLPPQVQLLSQRVQLCTFTAHH